MPPLTGAKAEAPDYRDQTPLVYYRPGEWKRQVISTENSGVVHGIFIMDWDGDGRDDILTAGFDGIHLFQFGKNGAWTRTEIAEGRSGAVAEIGIERHRGRQARQGRDFWRRSSPGTATRSPSTVKRARASGSGR